MNLGDKGARVHLRLMLGLRADKRPAWKQLWLPRQKDDDLLKIQPEKCRKGEVHFRRKKSRAAHMKSHGGMNYSGGAPARPAVPWGLVTDHSHLQIESKAATASP